MTRNHMLAASVRKQLKRRARELRPYLDDLAGVLFVAALTFAVIAAAAEALIPGFVVNYVSPRVIVLALVLLGALKAALALDERPAPTRSAWAVSAALGAAAAVGAALAAWYHFGESDGRLVLAASVAAVAAAVFWAALRRPDDQEE